MDSKDIRNLVESYQNVYAEQEVSEDMYSTVKGGLEKGAEALKNSPAGGVVRFLVGPVGSNKGKRTPSKKDQDKKIEANEDVELYNIVFNHLIEEGFASSEENAHKIISVMSDEWISSIVEGVGGYDDPVAGPHTPIGKAVRSGLKTAGNVATQVVKKTVPPNIRSAVAKKAKEITSGRYGPPGSNY